MNYAVLLPKIFNYPLTYKSKKKISFKVGDIVEVPFGKTKEIGVIWDSLQKTSKKINIRSIEKKLQILQLIKI